MAQSAVDIVNLALVLIGQTSFIQSLTEDSEAANVANVVFEQDRDEVLVSCAWPVRRSRPAPLVATTLTLGEVPGGWGYAFTLPADCATKGLTRIFGVRNPRTDQEVPFAIEYDAALGTLVVLADLNTPEFVYVMQLADTTLFPPLVTRAMAWRLGEDLALGVRKDPKLGTWAHGNYLASLGVATAGLAQFVRPDSEPIPAHIAAR
jgi:hypothetical protein